jgi:transposase
MSDTTTPTRFIGLDIHKEYFVASGVNAKQETVFGPQRVPNTQLDVWINKHLTNDDAVVLEMTTNTYAVYDALVPQVHSVTVVHPPHVALITRAQVKTDRKAALGLAQLHAAGLLVGIWIPPQPVRDLRALIAERWKMVRLKTQAKNRLHAVLHRHHLLPPEGRDLFATDTRDWWEQLPLTPLELVNVQCDLDTLAFAEKQSDRLKDCLAKAAAQDDRVPLLVQLPGIGLIGAMTILAALGDITRFPTARQLVGYAGLGARVHDSGKTHDTGRITKAGRRDLRHTMVEAAQSAVRTHPHWKAELERLEPRLGRPKAIVAIARKLLVGLWHVLTESVADRFADDTQVARSFFALAYKVGVRNLLGKKSALVFTREQLDRLHLGAELTQLPWGSKTFNLPPPRNTGTSAASAVVPAGAWRPPRGEA